MNKEGFFVWMLQLHLPHCTHILQPVDVAITSSLKTNIVKYMAKVSCTIDEETQEITYLNKQSSKDLKKPYKIIYRFCSLSNYSGEYQGRFSKVWYIFFESNGNN